MLSVQKPSIETIRRFLSSEADLPFTYEEVGLSATKLEAPPAGFVLDQIRVNLGEGEAVFRAAKAAIENWKQFRLGWVDAWAPPSEIKANETVAVLGHAVGLWWLNSCRIIYVIDESGPKSRFGFGYGTLPGHAMCGEERFLIEWDPQERTVWYQVLAFSRPRHFLTKLGYSVVRKTQKQFGRDSSATMLKAVQANDVVRADVKEKVVS